MSDKSNKKTGNVVSVNISDNKGTIKKPVNEIEVTKTGIIR